MMATKAEKKTSIPDAVGETHYDRRFFETIVDGSKRSANVIAPIVVNLVHPQTVVDVGCGTGSWLQTFLEAGVEDGLGIDGDYVDRRQLVIDPEQFLPMNLSQPEQIGRRFDLAINLEVSEHLPTASSARIVEFLTGLADVVLFSAAIPGQQGTNHINEQWPTFWESLFHARGYVRINALRPRIWMNQDVKWWYRQNAVLYVRREALSNYPDLLAIHENESRGEVRLELIAEHVLERLILPTPRELLGKFPAACWRALCRKFGKAESPKAER